MTIQFLRNGRWLNELRILILLMIQLFNQLLVRYPFSTRLPISRRKSLSHVTTSEAWSTESVITWLRSIDQGVLHDSARLETWNIQISDSCIDVQSIGCNRLRHLNVLGISLSLIHLNVSVICLCKQNISQVWPCLFLHPKYGIEGIIRSFIIMEWFSKSSLWIGCFCDCKSVFLSFLLLKALLAVISLSLSVLQNGSTITFSVSFFLCLFNHKQSYCSYRLIINSRTILLPRPTWTIASSQL